MLCMLKQRRTTDRLCNDSAAAAADAGEACEGRPRPGRGRRGAGAGAGGGGWRLLRRRQDPPRDEAPLQLLGEVGECGGGRTCGILGQLQGSLVDLHAEAALQLGDALHDEGLLADLLLRGRRRKLRREQGHGLVHLTYVPLAPRVEGLVGGLLARGLVGGRTPQAVEARAFELRWELVRLDRCAEPQLLVLVMELENVRSWRRRGAVARTHTLRLHTDDHRPRLALD
mmetsp:Transcript_126926/g.329302  ORF Transcript_126926/g.329302 Transcript_126926/m.329302 type:complete len:228 (-) Transcript_126926:729-1412(-)